MTTPPRLSEQAKQLRDEMVSTRGKIQGLRLAHGWGDRFQNLEGLLTCGISSFYNYITEIVQCEIQQDDREFGASIGFAPRGIGLDMCPCCFVCGTTEREPDANDYLHNIAAFVNSKADAERILQWADGCARIDFREREPHRIQFKIGACTKHLPNLGVLYDRTAKYRVIREIDIVEARKEVETP